MYVPFDQLDNRSRIWVYQSDRPFDASEEKLLRNVVKEFITDWTSHNRALQSSFEIVENRIILISVDEGVADASGCSIDKMMHFVQALERDYGLSLLNRQLVTYFNGKNWQTTDLKELIKQVNEGQISTDSLMYDVLVSDKGSWKSEAKKPLKDSWLSRMI
jgi:hypothetical protein